MKTTSLDIFPLRVLIGCQNLARVPLLPFHESLNLTIVPALKTRPDPLIICGFICAPCGRIMRYVWK